MTLLGIDQSIKFYELSMADSAGWRFGIDNKGIRRRVPAYDIETMLDYFPVISDCYMHLIRQSSDCYMAAYYDDDGFVYADWSDTGSTAVDAMYNLYVELKGQGVLWHAV